MIRVITKKPGEAPDFDDAIVLRNGVTVKHVAHAIHRSIPELLKYALVWVRKFVLFLVRAAGSIISLDITYLISRIFYCFNFQGTSTKFSPQRVGASHKMHDEDVIQIFKK